MTSSRSSMADRWNRAWQQLSAFAGHDREYVAAYARWRALQLAEGLRQRWHPPTWPSAPGLSQAGLAPAAPAERAGPLLAAYLAKRPYPAFHFSPQGAAAIVQQIAPEQRAQTLARASALLRGQHTYRGITAALGDEPDWQAAPGGSVDWRWDLNRHYWLPLLARAWHYDRDEAYPRLAARLLRHWMQSNPPRVGSPVWRPFETATRINNWLWGLFLYTDSESFARDGAGHLWRGLTAQARYLNRHLERHVVNNHLLVESKTLAMMGVLFPELPESADWLSTGLGLLWTQVHRQFHPDGVHAEQAAQYHALCAGELWEIISLLRRNGHPAPRIALERFQASVAFLSAIIKPDGCLSLFGDSSRHDHHLRFDARWASAWFDQSSPAGALPEETRWLCGPSASGARPAPSPASRAFPIGGYVVMRDADWHLAFDCGPFGDAVVPSHAHADALSFELWAFGQTLLTDAGGYSYHAPPVWRSYFRGTAGHNTVVVDGQDQSELVGSRQVRQRARARLLQWQTTPMADWVVAEHDGYARLADPVIHRRHLLFVKPHYVLVVDSLLGLGDHSLEWHFHLPPGAACSAAPNGAGLSASIAGANLHIVTQVLPGLRLRVAQGETDPPRGWVSFESGDRQPAPEVIFSRTGRLPVHLPYVVAAFPSGQDPGCELRVCHSRAGQLSLTVTTKAFRDSIYLSLSGEPQPLTAAGFERVRASPVLVRCPKEGPSAALAFGVHEAVVGGRRLAPQPGRSWLSLVERQAEWHQSDVG